MTPTFSELTSGAADTEYQFTACSSDPYQGQSVSYTFNWGDGSQWTQTSFYPSGQQETFDHTYSSDGTYQVEVFAKSTTDVWRHCFWVYFPLLTP